MRANPVALLPGCQPNPETPQPAAKQHGDDAEPNLLTFSPICHQVALEEKAAQNSAEMSVPRSPCKGSKQGESDQMVYGKETEPRLDHEMLKVEGPAIDVIREIQAAEEGLYAGAGL